MIVPDDLFTPTGGLQGAEEAEEDRIAREKQDLITRVGSSDLLTLRHRVAWIMNQYPATRNSDIALQIKYWETFEDDIFRGRSILVNDLYRLTRLTSITRERARIQNQYRLFIADPEIRERRGTLEEDERERAVEAPDYPVYTVFLDESGKTSSYLIVGSLWFLSGGKESLILQRQVMELKDRSNFSGEFHFAHMKRDELQTYKELIDILLATGGTISFKFISVARTGIGDVQTALSDLYYHLLARGVDHENSTGRAPLPRVLKAWKDLEDPGADKILMANLSDRMTQLATSVYDKKLIVENFVAMESESNVFLQVADIIASSVNRVLCCTGYVRNHKDELAEYLLERLGISPNAELEIKVGDLAAHIRL